MMIRKKTIEINMQKSIRAHTFGFSSGDSSSPSPSLGRATTVFTNVIQSLPPVKATSLHHSSNKKALSRAVSEGSANNTNNSLPAATHVMVHHRNQASSHSKPPEKSR